MVIITGDTHGDFRRFSTANFPEQKEMTRDDRIIICGDFGGVWSGSNEEEWWLNWLAQKNFTICFIDGNHECLNKNTDILTEHGWVNVEDLYNSDKDIKIATYNMKTKEIEYDYPTDRIKSFSNTIIDIFGKNYKQSVTPNHDVIINGKKVKAMDLIGEKIKEESLRSETKYTPSKTIDLSDDMLNLITAIIIDGTVVDYSIKNKNSKKMRIQFHIKKQDKIIFIENLLNNLKIHYTKRVLEDNETYICIHGDYAREIWSKMERKKEFPFYFSNLSELQFENVLNAIVKTDGSLDKNNMIIWRTTNKNDADIIQELCLKYNYDMKIKVLENASGYTTKCKTQYACGIKKNKRLDTYLKITEREYNDYAYCFSMPNTTLVTRYNNSVCITGNCFDLLALYPVVDYCGGKAHKIRDNIYHLMRGYVFTFEDKKFFAFGGARSHDVDGGIFEPEDKVGIAKAKKSFKPFRINHVSWWKEEMPSENEMNEGIKNLEKVNYEVDFVITHCLPTQILKMRWWFMESDELTRYFDTILQNLKFSLWYAGHYHVEEKIFGKFEILFEKIKRII